MRQEKKQNGTILIIIIITSEAKISLDVFIN